MYKRKYMRIRSVRKYVCIHVYTFGAHSLQLHSELPLSKSLYALVSLLILYYWRRIFPFTAPEKLIRSVSYIGRIYMRVNDILWSMNNRKGVMCTKLSIMDEIVSKFFICRNSPFLFLFLRLLLHPVDDWLDLRAWMCR